MNMREASIGTWTSGSSVEHINCGSLQRIADATEKMAASYDALRDERDRYQRWYKEERSRREQMERRYNAVRGVVTRLRRKAALPVHMDC